MKGVKKIEQNKEDKETGLLVETSILWGTNNSVNNNNNNNNNSNTIKNNKFDCLCLSSFFLFPGHRYKSFTFSNSVKLLSS